MPTADESKIGRRGMASSDGGPPWDSWGQGGLLQLSSADPWLPRVKQKSALPRPVLLGQRLQALAGDVTSCKRLGITEPQRKFFLIPIRWFKP